MAKKKIAYLPTQIFYQVHVTATQNIFKDGLTVTSTIIVIIIFNLFAAGMAPSVLAEGMKEEGLALKRGLKSSIEDVSFTKL